MLGHLNEVALAELLLPRTKQAAILLSRTSFPQIFPTAQNLETDQMRESKLCPTLLRWPEADSHPSPLKPDQCYLRFYTIKTVRAMKRQVAYRNKSFNLNSHANSAESASSF